MAWIKAYKGFDKDMKCRGMQFKEGQEYEEQEAKLCEKGFHACENPLDALRYYEPGAGSIYREVELDATDEKAEDSKRCGKRIKIGARLDVAGICKAHFEYVKSQCDPVAGRVGGDKEAVSVGDKASAAAGESGSAAAGFRGSAAAGESGSAAAGFRGSAAAGESGSAAAGESGSAAAGNYGSAAAGNYGSAAAGESGSAAAGFRGSAAAGNYGSAAAGFRGSAAAGFRGSAAAGNYGSAISRGSSSVGPNGMACARGNHVKVRGGLGAVLVIAEENANNYDIYKWAATVVDGEKIKPDTWYELKDGEFTEVEANENHKA